MAQYRTIIADPPWRQPMIGKYKLAKHAISHALPYPTMTTEAICALPVERFADVGAHLWLWTTNAFLDPAFDVMRAWGFTYLTTVTWIKPSGSGAWFASTTQHCLFGYYRRCQFNGRRYAPTHFRANPKRHSEKPPEFYDLAEAVSDPLRLELFARKHRLGWATMGNEISGKPIQEELDALASIV